MAFRRPTETVSSKHLHGDLAHFLRKAERGERVIITLYNREIAALVPVADERALRALETTTVGERTMNVITCANLSGGAGKSTCTRELAYALSEWGYRVGIIDLDPQASLTRNLGLLDGEGSETQVPAELIESTIFDAAIGRTRTLPAPTRVDGVDVWPANKQLTMLEPMLYVGGQDLTNLRAALQRMKDDYDFILLDPTPARTALLTMALAASDSVIVPVSELKDLDNLDSLQDLLNNLQGISPSLHIRLYIPNKQHANQRFYQAIHRDLQLLEEVQKVMVAPAIQQRSATINDALLHRRAVVLHAPGSEAAREFREAARALLRTFGLNAPQEEERKVSERAKPKAGKITSKNKTAQRKAGGSKTGKAASPVPAARLAETDLQYPENTTVVFPEPTVQTQRTVQP